MTAASMALGLGLWATPVLWLLGVSFGGPGRLDGSLRAGSSRPLRRVGSDHAGVGRRPVPPLAREHLRLDGEAPRNRNRQDRRSDQRAGLSGACRAVAPGQERCAWCGTGACDRVAAAGDARAGPVRSRPRAVSLKLTSARRAKHQHRGSDARIFGDARGGDRGARAAGATTRRGGGADRAGRGDARARSRASQATRGIAPTRRPPGRASGRVRHPQLRLAGSEHAADPVPRRTRSAFRHG